MKVWIEKRTRRGQVRYGVVGDLGEQPGRRCVAGCPGVVWEASVSKCEKCSGGLGTATLERRRLNLGTYERKKDADQRRREVEAEAEQHGAHVLPSRLTVGSYLEETWFRALRAENLKESVAPWYERIARTYLMPKLGTLKLQDLAPAHLKALYGDLLERGGRNGRPLSPSTVKQAHVTASKALEDACTLGLLSRNPARQVRPPKQRKRAPKAWTRQESRAFLESARGDRLYAAYLLFATTGMRRGEGLALRWADVDLSAARLAVQWNLVVVDRAGDRLVLTECKSGRGRSVPLPPETIAALKGWKARQAEERLAAGAAWEDRGLVFCAEDGSLLSPESFSDAFDRAVNRAGVSRLTIHGMRHTFATLALQAGVPVKVVSEILGHANVSITYDTYSHVIPSMMEEATSKVAGLIFGTDTGGTL